MRPLPLPLLLLGVATAAPATTILRPPERFITTGSVLLRTTDAVSAVCTGEYDRACTAGTVVVTDNPCDYPREVYATRLCHEMAHALRHWRHETR